MVGKGQGKRSSGKVVPGFARGRGSAAFRDLDAPIDADAIQCSENPAGVHVHNGALYIAESVDDRVVRIKDGIRVVIAGGNGKGARPDQFDRPFRIHVDNEGVYVADRNNARVQFWAHGASKGETVAGGNGAGHAASQLNQPAGVVIDGKNIFVADRANHRIMQWTLGSHSKGGVVVAGGNGFGSGMHQLGCPGALCIIDAILYISDESNARIQRWVPGAKEGCTVAGGFGNGANRNQLYHPLGISSMDGNLLICDSTNHRIQLQKFVDTLRSVSDNVPSTICGGFGIGSGPGELGHPMDCYWDGCRLYVSDWYHACVRTYTAEALQANSTKPFGDQAMSLCDGKRYTGRVAEWRDHGGYGFVIDDMTGKRYMAHNSDIANSMVEYGYAVLTVGEHVEYLLLRDIVGKWKCDAVSAVGGGPVSSDQVVVDMSINSGTRSHMPTKKREAHHFQKIEYSCRSMGEPTHADALQQPSQKAKGRRWVRKGDVHGEGAPVASA